MGLIKILFLFCLSSFIYILVIFHLNLLFSSIPLRILLLVLRHSLHILVILSLQ